MTFTWGSGTKKKRKSNLTASSTKVSAQTDTCNWCKNKLGGKKSSIQYILASSNLAISFPNYKFMINLLFLNTNQIKDMALKVSGAYRQCKPSSGSSSNYKQGHQRPYTDYDTVSEGVNYPYLREGGSSSSTPAWDFPPVNRSHASDSRFKGMSGDGQSGDMLLVNDDEPKEWMAQVEPGVHITFLSLPQGGNDLKRIRFRYNLATITFTFVHPPLLNS